MDQTLPAQQQTLGVDETRDSLIASLQVLADHREHLNALDQALGDGDHGSTMHRGAEAAMAALRQGRFSTVNQLFEAIGAAMMTSMGGASGILFGVWFRAAKHCQEVTQLDAATVKRVFERGLQDLQKKSPAVVGDKTMMDALIPATETLAGADGTSLGEVLQAMAEAAAQGADHTVGLLPRYGRATTLGERVREARDPGAASISLFFTTFAGEVKKKLDAGKPN